MNKSTVVGFLGEVVVREKLISEGLNVHHKGNQSGYDLGLDTGQKIDVKAGTPRDDFGSDKDFWSWALLSGSKKRKPVFSHIVCVAFDRTMNAHRFYVIKYDDLPHFPPGIKRFNVKRSYHTFETIRELPPRKIQQWEQVYAGCLAASKNGYVREVKPDESLADKIIH